MKSRTKSRELALHLLYAYEIRPDESWETLCESIIEPAPYSTTIKEYARALSTNTIERLDSIDVLLQDNTDNWDIKRLSAIDRNVMRLAVAELLCFDSVPFKVVIDEAVELAKNYGTEGSGKFVNGVVDAIYKNMNKTRPSERKGTVHGTDPQKV
jgi:N utilization substance protein B